MRNKKAQSAIDGLQALIVPLVAIGVVLVVAFLIMAEAKTEIEDTDGVYPGNCTNKSEAAAGTATYPSRACNATTETQNAIQDIPGWLPIIIITAIGALLLGLVAMFRRN